MFLKRARLCITYPRQMHKLIQGAHVGIIRSYNVLFCVFTFIRLLERSYLWPFFQKGLIKVLFLVLNETSF